MKTVFILWLSVLTAICFGCGQSSNAPSLRHFDRPSDVTFSCVGNLRLSATDEVLQTSAMPQAMCDSWDEGAPEGQENLVEPKQYGVVLQSNRGSVALIDVGASANAGSDAVLDSDLLTPGKNDIPVGTQPVGIAMDDSGCFAITANAGSCDLSALQMSSAVDSSRSAEVSKITILDMDGEVMDAKPSDIVFAPQEGELGVACPDHPTGIAYVSFASCDLVVAVDVATGQSMGGVAFESDGSARLATPADMKCSNECSAANSPSSDGAVRPTALAISLVEGRPLRLFVGSQSSSMLNIVEMGANLMPLSIEQVALEGTIGIREINTTPLIEMGGDVGVPLITFGPFQFAYIVVSDGTIRVVDVDKGIECDTQVDPRYLQNETDVSFLSCMPVGDVRTPPRRSDAKGPGIQLPGIVTSIAFSTITETTRDTDNPSPLTMLGTFAFASTTNGRIYVINVDDDNYGDKDGEGAPKDVLIPLAIAHQPRDTVSDRYVSAGDSCETPDPRLDLLGSRLSDDPDFRYSSDVSIEKRILFPRLRQVECVEDNNSMAIPELAYAAPDSLYDQAFPDVLALRNQTWLVSWQGRLSQDTNGVAIDGPPIREAIIDSDSDRLYIDDDAKPFCASGVEVGDIADINGCTSDQQCGIGETCYIHPDSTSSIRGGLCVSEDSTDAFAANCRDFLVSRRSYRVEQAQSRTLALSPRASVLSTTPIDGCDSDNQCMALAEERHRLNFSGQPQDPLTTALPNVTYQCIADPTRSSPTQNDCVMTCEYDPDADPSDDTKNRCEDARICRADGICVEGEVPPRSCLQSVQRYQLRAGDAFSVVGSTTGFVHNRMADPGTGICVDASEYDPFAVGRIPLRPEPCDEDDDPQTGPNPCLTTLEDSAGISFYNEAEFSCQSRLETRDVPAIRYSNAGLTFHLVNTETNGDAECISDEMGSLPSHALVDDGFDLEFEIMGGFLSMIIPNVTLAFPVVVKNAPDGRIWAVDQGDSSDAVSAQRGQILTFEPDAAEFDFSAAGVR